MNREEAVSSLKEVFQVLQRDLDEAVEYGKRERTDFAVRSLVRTYFAFIEGVAAQMRQVTLATLQNSDVLSTAELAILKDERYSLDSKGKPESKENYQTFLPTLLFTIRCYLKNHGATYEPKTGEHGWGAMKDAVSIRNRLTHPKSLECLAVSADDEAKFVAAAEWWKSTLLEVFAACAEADEFWKEQLAQGKQ